MPLSLVLGAELAPGLYRLRPWIACAVPPTARDGRGVWAEVLVAGPGDMDLPPVTGEDVLHEGRGREVWRPAGYGVSEGGTR